MSLFNNGIFLSISFDIEMMLCRFVYLDNSKYSQFSE